MNSNINLNEVAPQVSDPKAGPSPDPTSAAEITDWQGSVQLNEQTVGKGGRSWARYTLYPFVASSLGYAVHRYYRRHRPRQLPVFTPLRVPELYILPALYWIITKAKSASLADMILDSDPSFLILELAGKRAQKLAEGPFLREIEDGTRGDEKFGLFCKALRDGNYNSSSLGGKLTWWHYNMWSDQDTWNKWASVLSRSVVTGLETGNPARSPLSKEDLRICITHLANRSSDRRENWVIGLEIAFVFSIPIAMLARWTGRRALSLPMNGLQRLLMGAWIYAAIPEGYFRRQYLHKIREKDKAARLMIDVFGELDSEASDLWELSKLS